MRQRFVFILILLRRQDKIFDSFWGDTQGNLNGEMSCEIVETSKVPDLLKNAPQDISFGVGRCRNLKCFYNNITTRNSLPLTIKFELLHCGGTG